MQYHIISANPPSSCLAWVWELPGSGKMWRRKCFLSKHVTLHEVYFLDCAILGRSGQEKQMIKAVLSGHPTAGHWSWDLLGGLWTNVAQAPPSYPDQRRVSGTFMHRFLCSWIKGSCLGVAGLPLLLHLPAPWGKDMLVLALEAGLAYTKMAKARGRGLATVASATNPQYKSLRGKNQLYRIPDIS